MPLAQVESDGAVHYIHPDHLNTPQKMTDSARAVTWSRGQQPFGEDIAPVLSSLSMTNGQFRMVVSGDPNGSYVVKASDSLGAAWVSVATNAPPFVFAEAGTQGARFYRVVSAYTATNSLRFPGQYLDAEPALHYNLMRDYDASIGRYIESDPIGLDGGSNLYEYAFANPITLTDPSGEFVPLIGLAVGALYVLTPHSSHAPQLDDETSPRNDFQPFINGLAALPLERAAAGGGMLLKRFCPPLIAKGLPSLENILSAGQALDRGGLTKAGRALEKHGSRIGSVYPRATGNVVSKNAQGQRALANILKGKTHSRRNGYGGLDIINDRTGKGVRLDQNGNMMGFLEP